MHVRSNNEEKLLAEISRKLNVLISLSIRQVSKDQDLRERRGQVGENARYLAACGLEAKDIAEIIGAPITSVRTLLTPSRKR